MNRATPTKTTLTGSRPIRTCVGCGNKADVRGLVRFVLQPSGVFLVDLDRRAPGRGAHVHPHLRCLDRAARVGFRRSFRMTIPSVGTRPEEMLLRAVDERVWRLAERAARAGLAVRGPAAVADALARGRVTALVTVPDDRLCSSAEPPTVAGTVHRAGCSVGRGVTMLVGVVCPRVGGAIAETLAMVSGLRAGAED